MFGNSQLTSYWTLIDWIGMIHYRIGCCAIGCDAGIGRRMWISGGYRVWRRGYGSTLFTLCLGQTLVFVWDSAQGGKFSFYFQEFLASIEKNDSFLQGDWALVYNSSKFWDFLDISEFPKILSLKLFWNFYIPCLLLIMVSRFTYGKRIIW